MDEVRNKPVPKFDTKHCICKGKQSFDQVARSPYTNKKVSFSSRNKKQEEQASTPQITGESSRTVAQILRWVFFGLSSLFFLYPKFSSVELKPGRSLRLSHCALVGIQNLQSSSVFNMATNAESQETVGPESASSPETETDDNKCSPCGCMSLDKHEEARGANFHGIGRGAISMSNVYLSNSLILLACIQAGGASPNNRQCIDQTVRVYGFRPASLISNIYAGAGLVAAFLMPVIGAMIDFSPHRKKIGVIMAVLLALISGIQIGTVEVRADRCSCCGRYGLWRYNYAMQS